MKEDYIYHIGLFGGLNEGVCITFLDQNLMHGMSSGNVC